MHLSLHLTTPDARPAVVADACALIDQEVARTSGISGMAIRSAYRVLTGIRPGMVPSAVDGLLDPFADQLDPFYQQHVATGEPLTDILTAQRTSMAEALLSHHRRPRGAHEPGDAAPRLPAGARIGARLRRGGRARHRRPDRRAHTARVGSLQLTTD